jgi:hypothetical protein
MHALRGLKQLQALELGYSPYFDVECLVAVAGNAVWELWLGGGAATAAWGRALCSHHGWASTKCAHGTRGLPHSLCRWNMLLVQAFDQRVQ